jgi:hypothetical protein
MGIADYQRDLRQAAGRGVGRHPTQEHGSKTVSG